MTQQRLQIVCTPAAQYEALAAQLYRLTHTGTGGGGRVMLPTTANAPFSACVPAH
ncbi:hypothetical protein XOC_3561 [Xanthomonas oryzae pv. oryzicola BLS256]|uniref:Uncharacterized protein n=1 Tax=Xanthomonas oryzae pv. oryzicola (strain BLS256) TaxID=383407 RepID=G7TED6_XANOB|nr:hypothetical protein XOC_3561 [Xanthomonas oryzae pv. oryzicola BLS256]